MEGALLLLPPRTPLQLSKNNMSRLRVPYRTLHEYAPTRLMDSRGVWTTTREISLFAGGTSTSSRLANPLPASTRGELNAEGVEDVRYEEAETVAAYTYPTHGLHALRKRRVAKDICLIQR